jgi:hypothetical protein
MASRIRSRRSDEGVMQNLAHDRLWRASEVALSKFAAARDLEPDEIRRRRARRRPQNPGLQAPFIVWRLIAEAGSIPIEDVNAENGE